jgi:S-DNA-T family DNA segregation ATPase FtsK/SpoIIIE
VALRDVMESANFDKLKGYLRLGLGQDVSGTAIAAKLDSMPHLLIAGTTGSGKSVCVNAIIACLLLQNTPDDLKFVMVDPKRVELTSYNGIPHLLSPVVVELERVVASLQWVTREMDERYRKFAKAGVRNIGDYNERVAANNEKKLPYLVVIIDELADLMMLAPDETERTITRLAQLARATGVHLIIATQRPSVDVVTGLIKANFPARIAFAVASGVDSRVILDQPGAERLLGRGDMLFQSPDAATPLRMQGVFVSDNEIQRIVRYWKGARGVETVDVQVPAASGAPGGAAPADGARPAARAVPLHQQPLWDTPAFADVETRPDGEDELLDEAIKAVRELKKASISLLQRRLRIGYTRSARLIDVLEEKGIIGPAESGAKPREVINFGDGADKAAAADPAKDDRSWTSE